MKKHLITSVLKEKGISTEIEVIPKNKGAVRLKFKTPGLGGRPTEFAVTLSSNEAKFLSDLLFDLTSGEKRNSDEANCLQEKREYFEAVLIEAILPDDTVDPDDTFISIRYGSDLFHKEASITNGDAITLAALLAGPDGKKIEQPAEISLTELRKQAWERLPMNYLMQKKQPLFS